MNAENPKKAVLRGAINDKCKSCIYDDLAPGTWRKQVENCAVTACPLYPYRPIAAYGRKAQSGEPKQTPEAA